MGELSPRSQDRVLAIGEELSWRITASSLESKVYALRSTYAIQRQRSLSAFQGVHAQVVLLNDIVRQAYQTSAPEIEVTYEKLGIHFFDALTSEIGERIMACAGRVPVIAGNFHALSM